MKLINIPFIIITASTLIGIVIGYYFPVSLSILMIGFASSVLILGWLWQRSKKMFQKGGFFGAFLVWVFILFGFTLVQIHNPRNGATHYTHHISSENSKKESVGIQFYIKERLKPTEYYQKYIASITILQGEMVTGDLLLRVPKNAIDSILKVGNSYTSVVELKPIGKPRNPFQFDYARHMAKQYVYHQFSITPDALITTLSNKWSVYKVADQVRAYINKKLSLYPFTQGQLAVINALVLGQRQDIDLETLNAYRNAGAIHILAVSGLHVGILLLLLEALVKPLRIFRKHGKKIQLVLIVLLLWGFAIIAGLSPSVLRAVTMFSFLAVGRHLRSKQSIYNSLSVSMFILLCFRPLYLFSVGFQLSYLSVFAIVWIQPLLAKWYHPKFYIDKKIWETFTVTIAAQLGLLPLTLYYFHQFPLLFFVSNLLILPFLGGILGVGIFIIVLAVFGFLPEFMVSVYGSIIDSMNFVVNWVAQQDSFLITEISFSWKTLTLMYIILILGTTLFQKFSIKKSYGFGFAILLLFGVLLQEKWQHKQAEELVVFHHPGHTTFGVLEAQQLTVFCKAGISQKTGNYLWGNYKVEKNAKLKISTSLKNTYRYKEKVILIIDSSSIYNLPALKPDIILLSNGPKIHLDRVIDSLKPQQIIADGSNYQSTIDHWEESCKKRKIPFYRTDRMGAYMLK